MEMSSPLVILRMGKTIAHKVISDFKFVYRVNTQNMSISDAVVLEVQ